MSESFFNSINGVRLALVSMFLVLSMAFICMPVAAETEVMLQGTVQPTFSITVEPAYVTFPMVVGSNEVQSTWVNSTGNTPFAIKIRDTGDIAGFTNAGFKFLDSSGTPTGYMLNPLQAKLGTHAYVSITKTDNVIYQGVAGVFSDRISYKQVVDITDKSTSGDQRYFTKVTISGMAI